MFASKQGRCGTVPIVRPLGGATILTVIGRDFQEYVVSIPCKIDGSLRPGILAIKVGTVERAAAWASAAGDASKVPQ